MNALGVNCFLFLAIFLLPISSYAQEERSLKFVFYNVENLFDTYNDSLVNDDEFTPAGSKNWNSYRYYSKLDNISKTLTAIGGWELPALVGLCEVENRRVLLGLTGHRLLKEGQYGIIHRDSPDRRGIDVALLYRPDVFIPDTSIWIPVIFGGDSEMTTRDILYVKGRVFSTDTLHIFINHWPSRWGGVEQTMPKRVEAASTLRIYTDSLFGSNPGANILIAGDLNDNPVDSSVYRVLGVKDPFSESEAMLYNLMFGAYYEQGKGSLKYRADWEVYDQLIVSSSLLQNNGLYVVDSLGLIFRSSFLLSDDETHMGEKPFRTYTGPRYLGGYSDHLPVYIKLRKE